MDDFHICEMCFLCFDTDDILKSHYSDTHSIVHGNGANMTESTHEQEDERDSAESPNRAAERQSHLRWFECPICARLFNRAGHLERHLTSSVHNSPANQSSTTKPPSGIEPAPICSDIAFTSALTTGLSSNSAINYHQCSACDRRFPNNCHLTRHMKFSHAVAAKLIPILSSTPLNNQSIKSNQSISSDPITMIDQKPQIDNESILSSAISNQSIPVFVCAQCGRKFVSASGLSSHQVIHVELIDLNETLPIDNTIQSIIDYREITINIKPQLIADLCLPPVLEKPIEQCPELFKQAQSPLVENKVRKRKSSRMTNSAEPKSPKIDIPISEHNSKSIIVAAAKVPTVQPSTERQSSSPDSTPFTINMDDLESEQNLDNRSNNLDLDQLCDVSQRVEQLFEFVETECVDQSSIDTDTDNQSIMTDQNIIANQPINTGQSIKCGRCPICGIALQDEYRRRNHARVHSEHRPYECDVCHFKFKHPQNLKRHADKCSLLKIKQRQCRESLQKRKRHQIEQEKQKKKVKKQKETTTTAEPFASNTDPSEVDPNFETSRDEDLDAIINQFDQSTVPAESSNQSPEPETSIANDNQFQSINSHQLVLNNPHDIDLIEQLRIDTEQLTNYDQAEPELNVVDDCHVTESIDNQSTNQRSEHQTAREEMPKLDDQNYNHLSSARVRVFEPKAALSSSMGAASVNDDEEPLMPVLHHNALASRASFDGQLGESFENQLPDDIHVASSQLVQIDATKTRPANRIRTVNIL